VSFKNAFKENSNLLNVGSKAWQKYINSKAPQGMYYQFDGDSNYYLKPKGNSSLKMKAKIILPDELKDIKVNNAEEFSQLIYRSQKVIEIQNPRFSNEGTPIAIEQLQKSFNSKIESKSGKFFIIPEPFNDPFNIPIKINDIEYFFEIKQVPFPSLREVRFESSKDGMIFIKIAYKEEENQLNFSLTYNLKKAESITEIYAKKRLLEGLAEGHVKIFERDAKVLTEDESSALKNLIFFYSKLYEIEQVLDIQFNPKENIRTEDVLNVYKLHISFVENKYYYDNTKHDTFEITLKEEADFSSEEDLAMLGYNEVTVSILDQTIQMAEQFVFKCTEPSEENKKKNEKGEAIRFHVKDDNIRYNKLFNEIPDAPDMNKISEKLMNAINIEEVQNISQ
jgi:hypothetical protein